MTAYSGILKAQEKDPLIQKEISLSEKFKPTYKDVVSTNRIIAITECSTINIVLGLI